MSIPGRRTAFAAAAAMLAASAGIVFAPRAFAANEQVNVYLTTTNGSGALSAATRNDVMTKLFSPTAGIGVSATRNVIGSSDLAWMKDNNSYNQGYLKAEYYKAYAQYFVKYIQGYEAQGVHVNYVTEQNEPGCCPGYPSMQWSVSGLQSFAKNDMLPALQAAGLGTNLLVHDWNYSDYDTWGAPLVNDAAIRNHPKMGHLTKFVMPGAVRIDSTANATVKNVAWKNPDGSKALIAYNTGGGAQSVKVNWGG